MSERFTTGLGRKQGVFTLLEILSALAIAAIGITAVARATQGHVEMMQSSEDRVIAGWVASNYLASMRLGRRWRAPGENRETVVFAGRSWLVVETRSATDDPDIVRVDLDVYREADPLIWSAALFGYMPRPEINAG